MNAPETLSPPPTASLVPTLPIAQIWASATNRVHKDQDYLEGLAATIKSHGVIQPITVRPWPAARKQPEGVLYEIVVGEGRWLASRIAGLSEIPAFWRDLDDKQALEMQLIENVKRKDIGPLDEARSYRRLIDEHGHTADTLAAQIKKSRAYIYTKLKLLDLCPAARKFVENGELSASTALLVARIPVHDLQVKAAEKIIKGYSMHGDSLSEREASSMLQREFMLRLAEAPFSRTDIELVPGAGRCHDCAKRTGNNADLFTDVKSADICTDLPCYEAKKKAHIDAQRARAKADNLKIIEGAEAKKIKPYSYTDDLGGGYVDLDKKIWTDGKQKTVRQILGKDTPPAEALLIDPHDSGKTLQVVATATLKDKLAAKGIAAPSSVVRQGKSDAEKEAERKRKQEGIFRQRLFDSTRGAIAVSFDTREEDSVLDLREFRQIADGYFHGMPFESQKRLAVLWIGPTEKTDDHELVRLLKKRIATMERKDCARLLLEASLVGEIPVSSYGSQGPENLLATADALDINAAAIKRGVINEMREKARAKKAPKAKAEPKAKANAKAAEKVQPETALSADEPLATGDRVRVRDNIKAPLGAKFIGKEGKVAGLIGKAFMVVFPRKTQTTSFDRSELDKLPALAEPASTPSNAAQANVKGATAAPAKAKAASPKKTKAKASPAPASPANEPAAPVKTPTLSPNQAWPFPTGARP